MIFQIGQIKWDGGVVIKTWKFFLNKKKIPGN